MRVLVLGHSSIAARRALPALLALDGVEAVDVASRRPLAAAALPAGWKGAIFDDYRRALRDSAADLVYVSLVNSLHEEWADAALAAGRHVVVDKPAVLGPAAAERLVERAERSGRCLAEAVVFADHPQMETVLAAVGDGGGATRIAAVFSVPPFARSNFRNRPELGGGSLNDLGPYAAALSRLVFGRAPAALACRVLTRHPETGVDTAFSVMATGADGRCLVGQFGFDTEYQNRVTIIGPTVAVNLERVFTIPPEATNAIAVSRNNQRTTLTAPPADSFRRFFRRLLEAIAAGAWGEFTAALLADARMVERMRLAAARD